MPQIADLTRKRIFELLNALVIVLGCCSISSAQPSDPDLSHPNADTQNRVLFLGNSFTGHIARFLPQMMADAGIPRENAYFYAVGGAHLDQYVDADAAMDHMRDGMWTYVVLQEQSQKPALTGLLNQEFHLAVDTLAARSRQSGAQPALFVTWGYENGSPRHPDLMGDYQMMQDRLTENYQIAATRSQSRLVPVGPVFAEIWREDAALARQLYADDGSHLSSAGAFVASLIVFRFLFDTSGQVDLPEQTLSRLDHAFIESLISQVRG